MHALYRMAIVDLTFCTQILVLSEEQEIFGGSIQHSNMHACDERDSF